MKAIIWTKSGPPDTKQSITIRLDRDVVEWFKSEGKGYQTRMNAVLRMYMEAQTP